MLYIFLVIFASSALFPRNCSDGWTYADGRCYVVHDVNVTYYNAYVTCALHGGDLAVITSLAQMTLISNMYA